MQTPSNGPVKCACPNHAALLEQRDALLEKVEALELKLFWKKYNSDQLKLAMTYANTADEEAPNCTCLACAASGRAESGTKGKSCRFKPYFEALLTEFHLSIGYAGNTSSCAHEDVQPDGNHVYDNDAHFVHVARDDWFIFTYGAKLWRATTRHDPELQKLERLFERLHQDDE